MQPKVLRVVTPSSRMVPTSSGIACGDNASSVGSLSAYGHTTAWMFGNRYLGTQHTHLPSALFHFLIREDHHCITMRIDGSVPKVISYNDLALPDLTFHIPTGWWMRGKTPLMGMVQCTGGTLLCTDQGCFLNNPFISPDPTYTVRRYSKANQSISWSKMASAEPLSFRLNMTHYEWLAYSGLYEF